MENKEEKKEGRRKKEGLVYWLAYTAAFLIMAWVAFHYFWANNRTMAWMPDGWRQHYKSLVYYSKWLRSIVAQFFAGEGLAAPGYSFSIGYGSDILTTLHYCAIGDPLNAFSVFVPEKYMLNFYEFLILARIYLAGLSFSYFCFVRGVKNKRAVFAAAFVYAFCGYALFAGVRHPYFLNPMIYLPLVLAGVERLLEKKKGRLLIASVFLSSISNFYFLYMIALLTVFYVLARVCSCFSKQEWKKAVLFVGKVAGYSFLGIMLSAVVLVPVLLVVADSSRMGAGYELNAFYNLEYYESFLPSFFTYASPGEWTRLGYAAVSILAILSLFMGKTRERSLKLGFVFLSLLLLLPAAGYAMNGFAYVSNRWCWGYSMLVAYILAKEWDRMIECALRKKLALTGAAALLFLLCLALCKRTGYGATKNFAAASFVAAAALLVLLAGSIVKNKNKNRIMEGLLLVLVFVNLGINSYFQFSEKQKDYTSQFKARSRFERDLNNNEVEAIRKAESQKDGFYRYTGTIAPNASLRSGLANTQFYWSLSNSVITDFIAQQALSENTAHRYSALDSRAMLCAAASVKYYVEKEDEGGKAVPFGYQEKLTENHYVVYQNAYALPLGYTYEGYLLQEDYEALPPAKKQEALLQGAVLEEPLAGYPSITPESTSRAMDYRIVTGKNVTQEGNAFSVAKKNASITLEFDGLAQCETYLMLQGVEYQGKPNKESDRYWTEQQVIDFTIAAESLGEDSYKTTLRYLKQGQEHYNGRHDFYVNLSYSEQPRNKVTITFPYSGTYSFAEIKVICQPMQLYVQSVEKLREDVLEEVDIHADPRAFATNRVTGKIALKEPKILNLSIPYSTGWSAYVDGKKEKLRKSGSMYMALPLEAGDHEIELRYRTPGKAAGMLVSGFTLFGLLFAQIFIKRREKSAKKLFG